MKENFPKNKIPPKIGILGGLGPLATVEFQKIFFEEFTKNLHPISDRDFPEIVVVHQTKTPDRTAHILDKSKPNPVPSLQNALLTLEKSGCNLIIIPCNTAHFFVSSLKISKKTKLINIIDAATICCLQQSKKSPLLLATAGTIRSKIYEKTFEESGLNLTIPDSKSIDEVMELIYGKNGVKAGFISAENQKKLAEIVARFSNCDSVILGCTELPLISSLISKSIIDPMRAAATIAISDFNSPSDSKKVASNQERVEGRFSFLGNFLASIKGKKSVQSNFEKLLEIYGEELFA